MTNPSCPFCSKTLALETHSHTIYEDSRRNESRGDFYVCQPCKKHWPRHAAITKHTARDGVAPRKVRP